MPRPGHREPGQRRRGGSLDSGPSGFPWSAHPGYVFIGNEGATFIDKLNAAMATLKPFLPETSQLDPAMRYATAGDLLL